MVCRFTTRSAAVLAGVAASLVLTGSSALAQQSLIVVTAPPPAYPRVLTVQRVGYWDLNLATPAGAEILASRVGRAVETVCLRDQGRWYGLSDPGYLHCTAAAWQRARPQMAEAIYEARQLAYNAGYRYYPGY